jgi:TPP-dependent pyruvate/acetoin dehydrogenase alpha subunit
MISGANGIVGGHMGIAVGAGLYSKISKNDAVTICFFGDGAATEGVFHEALNMAAVWKLPVVFVCENNQYAMSLPWSMSTVQPRFDLRAQAYGIHGVDVDGQSVLAVYDAARDAVSRARRGDGPTLIGAHTYRYFGHSRGDPSAYRSKQEEADWYARDPLKLFQSELMTQQLLTDEQVSAIEQRISAELDQAVQFAEASPLASVESAFEDVYA